MFLRNMFGSTSKQGSSSVAAPSVEESMETEPPASMPKPLWSNKTPSAKRPEAEPEEAEEADGEPAPPPKPLWSNKKSMQPAPAASSNEDDDVPVGLPPKPMWNNRKVPPALPQPPLPLLAGKHEEVIDVSDASATAASGSGMVPQPMRMSSEGKSKPVKHLQGQKYLYRLGKTLGKGSYAKVKECEAVDEVDRQFAVKIFKVSLLKKWRMWDSEVSGYKTAFDDVIREIAIMKKLNHENVMTLHDVIDDPNSNKLCAGSRC